MSDIDELKIKLADWKLRLNGPNVHSIHVQLVNILWRSAFYRSINESRRFLPDDASGGEQANGALHELIHDGYLTLHSAAIRRLVDKGAPSGPVGVWSLYGLIREIKDHSRLLTRANVLAARGLAYDFEPIKERAYAQARASGRAENFISRDGWADAEWWHKTMDKLCGVAAPNRSTADVPDPDRFKQLLYELADRGHNVQEYVNGYVAHPSSPDSRSHQYWKHRAPSLAELWLAERAVVRASTFVSHYIVEGTNFGGVPAPQFDQFAHLDKPFIQPSAKDAMQKAWNQHSEEIDSCENWFWDRPLTDQSDVWEDSKC